MPMMMVHPVDQESKSGSRWVSIRKRLTHLEMDFCMCKTFFWQFFPFHLFSPHQLIPPKKLRIYRYCRSKKLRAIQKLLNYFSIRLLLLNVLSNINMRILTFLLKNLWPDEPLSVFANLVELLDDETELTKHVVEVLVHLAHPSWDILSRADRALDAWKAFDHISWQNKSASCTETLI